MTPAIMLLAAASVSLILAACYVWGGVLEREAMDAQLEADQAALDTQWDEAEKRWAALDRKQRTMDAACNDTNGRCWNCTEPHRVLELVDVGTRYELTCPTCSELLKARRGRQEAA